MHWLLWCNEVVYPSLSHSWQDGISVIGWEVHCRVSGTSRGRPIACSPYSVFLPVMSNRTACGSSKMPVASFVRLSPGFSSSLLKSSCCSSCYFHRRTSPTAWWMAPSSTAWPSLPWHLILEPCALTRWVFTCNNQCFHGVYWVGEMTAHIMRDCYQYMRGIVTLTYYTYYISHKNNN